MPQAPTEQRRTLLSRLAWCCGGDPSPRGRALSAPTADFSQGASQPPAAASSADARLGSEPCRSAGSQVAPPGSCGATGDRSPGAPSWPAPVALRGSPPLPSDRTEESPLRLGVDEEPLTPPPGSASVEPVTPPPGALLEESQEEQQFVRRMLQLQAQAQGIVRGASMVSSPLSPCPVYGRGSPLWETPLEPDSDTDPDMPELISVPRVASSLSEPADFFHTLVDDDDDDDDDEESTHVPFGQKQGGLGACWGPNSLKNALQALDAEDESGFGTEQPNIADSRPTPF